jgi:alkanesulfonate monooxygenase SsuD/methylene tetrahydromethanopterin reductase-like flavin-dependent oxidoreductase (luciferase family)
LQAAEEVAVLDSLSDGRLILGIGRGFQQAMFSAFDIPLKEKRKRFSEVLETMIKAWAGEPVAWITGEDGLQTPVLLAPLPVQRPHPPIWVAAFGPLALRQAGSLGLPYLASPVETETALLKNYQQHATHAKSAGHPPIKTVPIMRILYVSKDPKRLAKVTALIEQQAFGQARRQPGTSLEDWAIIGTPEEVSGSIARYRNKLGITHLIASGRISGIAAEDYVDSLETLAELNGH